MCEDWEACVDKVVRDTHVHGSIVIHTKSEVPRRVYSPSIQTRSWPLQPGRNQNLLAIRASPPESNRQLEKLQGLKRKLSLSLSESLVHQSLHDCRKSSSPRTQALLRLLKETLQLILVSSRTIFLLRVLLSFHTMRRRFPDHNPKSQNHLLRARQARQLNRQTHNLLTQRPGIAQTRWPLVTVANRRVERIRVLR